MYDKDFANRIDFAVSKIGSMAKACQIINVSTPTISRWKDGTSDPKASNLMAFAQAANVSLDWLMTGNNSCKTTIEQPDDEYEYIPAYDIEASAGYGSFVNDEKPRKHLAFRSKWLKARGLHQKDLAAIFTKGDSMEPTIPNGAALIIDQSRNNAVDGNIYVVHIDDNLYVKRIQRIPSGLCLISDNKFYNPLNINLKEFDETQFQICGQVIHVSYDLPD